MVIRHRQCAINRSLRVFAQYQPGQRSARACSQPPAVIIVPTQGIQLLAHLRHQWHAARCTRQPPAAFGHVMQQRILRLPGLPETRGMPRPVPGKPQPVQLHAKALKIEGGRGLLGMPAQQAHRRETKALACCRQGMQMVGVGTAQTDQAVGPCSVRRLQIPGELEPLVAADQRINPVQTQHRHLDPGPLQPVKVHRLQRGSGVPVNQGQHQCRFHAKGSQFTAPDSPSSLSVFTCQSTNKPTRHPASW